VPRYLKTGISDDAKADADAQVRRTVEGILAAIEARGDAAVREYSERFDGWAPTEFRLSRSAIDACHKRVGTRERSDIEFAQARIRHFARIQRDALRDVECDTYQRITEDALVRLGEYCSRLCAMEHFAGHKEQADIRLRRYGGQNVRGLDVLPGADG